MSSFHYSSPTSPSPAVGLTAPPAVVYFAGSLAFASITAHSHFPLYIFDTHSDVKSIKAPSALSPKSVQASREKQQAGGTAAVAAPTHSTRRQRSTPMSASGGRTVGVRQAPARAQSCSTYPLASRHTLKYRVQVTAFGVLALCAIAGYKHSHFIQFQIIRATCLRLWKVIKLELSDDTGSYHFRRVMGCKSRYTFSIGSKYMIQSVGPFSVFKDTSA